MRYVLLACDYDGTIAESSTVDRLTIEAIERCLRSGRKLVLATGRLLDDLLTIFPQAEMFHRIIAENGAIAYDPATRTKRRLAEAPPAELVARLRSEGVAPLVVGEVIVATEVPNETVVLEAIRDLGLGHQIVFNNQAVMVLPPGVDKGSALRGVLDELMISPHNVVAVGDAENDHALLGVAESSVAVANALPLLQQRADWVTQGKAGKGICQLIDQLLADDLACLDASLKRHRLLLGRASSGEEISIAPYESRLLIAGPSGSGKSQTTLALLERMMGQGYQVCLFDPEGDYEHLESAVTLGGPDWPPSIEEMMQLLQSPSAQIVVNLLGMKLEDRPAFFARALGHLQDLRARAGRPHWLVIDEAHHLLPASWDAARLTLPQDLGSFVAVTVHPEKVSDVLLRMVGLVIAVGDEPDKTLANFAEATGRSVPPGTWSKARQPGEVIVWSPDAGAAPERVEVLPASWVHRRHTRKYARGELEPDRSFYFRGPNEKMNLRAQNLQLFVQLANGVDDETWTHHLRHGDYSRWIRDGIRDDRLANRIEDIEHDAGLSADASKQLVTKAIDESYTNPAK
jgi:hydroxymethylpyrimidine pyrophosphatase-like HAD family hydrolase